MRCLTGTSSRHWIWTRETRKDPYSLPGNTDFGEGVRRTQAKIHIVVGEKENRDILNSANLINMAIPFSTLTMIPNLYHGEASIRMHPEFMRIILELED